MSNMSQIGDGTTTYHVPVRVLAAANITAGNCTCSTMISGGVCWGSNAQGQLADGMNRPQDTHPGRRDANASGVGAGGLNLWATPPRTIVCWSGGLIPVTGGMTEQPLRFREPLRRLVVSIDAAGIPVLIDSSSATAVSKVRVPAGRQRRGPRLRHATAA
jgi:hypothetical protein